VTGAIVQRLSVIVFSIVVASMTGCITGRMLINPVDLDEVENARNAIPLHAGVRSLVRTESSFYQATFEHEIVRSLRASGLFASVVLDEFESNDVDVVLSIGKVDMSFRHHPNMVGPFLAVATLGIYMLVGAPVWTHEEYYEIPVRVEAPGKNVEFEIVSKTEESHWLGLYSRETVTNDGKCHGPSSYEAMNDLVLELGESLRANSLSESHDPVAERLAQLIDEAR
jgi:hypothetical protein